MITANLLLLVLNFEPLLCFLQNNPQLLTDQWLGRKRLYWEYEERRIWHWSEAACLWGIFLWQRACTALENANRQTMALPHAIKPEGVSRFTIWLSMCTTFVKYALLTQPFVLFFFFLAFFCLFFSVCLFILLFLGVLVLVVWFGFFCFALPPPVFSSFLPLEQKSSFSARHAFLPSVSACPQMLITAP